MMNSTLKKAVLLPAFGAAVLALSSCEAVTSAAFRMSSAILAAKASEQDPELGNEVRTLMGQLQDQLLPGRGHAGIASAEPPDPDPEGELAEDLDDEPLADVDELDEPEEAAPVETPQPVVSRPGTLGSLLGRAGSGN